jgi:DNA-binding MarR family transcriptional regulator
MPLERHASAGYLVNHLARLFARALLQRIGPLGVAPGQFPVLLRLWEAEGLTQAELAESLAVEQPTMANTLQRMERDGLIRRTPDPADGRRALVHLTERSCALEPHLTEAARAVNAAAFAGFSREEVQHLLSLVRRMVENLERPDGPGEPPRTAPAAGRPQRSASAGRSARSSGRRAV